MGGDVFLGQSLKPMLIGASADPFDDPGCVFELKLDGERALAYLDKGGTELRNKRDKRMLPLFPELREIHRQVRGRCILDGEYVVMRQGKPDFSEVQRRSLLASPFKIKLAANKLPVSFIAFDILYLDGRETMSLPLGERKALLEKTVDESPRLALSRCIDGQGVALYQLAKERRLEGVVAKRKDSRYYPGTRTKEWVKIKNLLDEDFVICGYIYKENHVVSLVLGRYRGGKLCYRGHVTLGQSSERFGRILARGQQAQGPPLAVPAGHGNERAVWLLPTQVCTVQYLEENSAGGLRHPLFKCLREDKAPLECADG